MTTAPDGADQIIQIRGVDKSFGRFQALSAIELDVARGEFMALLGASGCGKSTLLRMIAGFETPSGGQIMIDGRDMAAVPPHRRPVNMVFQSYALFPHMSVADNIAFGLRQDGVARRAVAERVAEMLALIQLEDFAQRRPHQLSGGQMQRVALARALARRPAVLLLDEPLSALDRKLRERTRDELVALQRRLGTTFVMVTHDQEEALAMADRVAVMHEGRIAQVGRPDEIYERPASRYVADFVGDINLFDGRILACESGRVAVEVGGARVVVAGDAAPAIGEAVTVAVRPEKIRLGWSALGDGWNCGTARVRQVAFRGETRLVTLETEGGGVMRVVVANAANGTGALPRPGEALRYAWPAASGVLLTR